MPIVTKNGTAVQGKANSFVLGPAVIHTHTAGAHVENAENAQDEEARNPLPIDDRKDTIDVATDPKDDNALATTSSAHHPRPRLHI